MALIFQETLTADGSTTAINWHTPRTQKDPRGTLYVSGDFGSGTVLFEVLGPGHADWTPVKDSSQADVEFTSGGSINFELYSDNLNPAQIRITLSGSSNPDLLITICNQD